MSYIYIYISDYRRHEHVYSWVLILIALAYINFNMMCHRCDGQIVVPAKAIDHEIEMEIEKFIFNDDLIDVNIVFWQN